MKFLVAILVLFSITNLQSAQTVRPNVLDFFEFIYEETAKSQAQNNVVISPVCVMANLAIIYSGAGGETADEIRFVFGVDERATDKQAEQYMSKELWRISDNGSSIFALFVNESLHLSAAYNKSSTLQFNAHIESVPFADAAAAVGKVNSWIKMHTNNTIENYLQANSVDKHTSMLALSGYQASENWQHPFNKSLTHKARFTSHNGQQAAVNMMFQHQQFMYAELPELNATALALPYAGAKTFMLILLPAQIDGLRALEEKIPRMGLKRIAEKMNKETVTVLLPKFKFDFEADLQAPLQKAGIRSMFSDKADFSKMFTTKTAQKVTAMKQKSFIEVNEYATGMGETSYIKHTPIDLISNAQAKIFRADHPFYFAIVDRDVIMEIVSGHFVK